MYVKSYNEMQSMYNISLRTKVDSVIFALIYH